MTIERARLTGFAILVLPGALAAAQHGHAAGPSHAVEMKRSGPDPTSMWRTG
jgi:hypothetical protein